MDKYTYSPKLDTTDVVIANTGTVSGAADLHGHTLIGIVTPAALTGVSFTVECSADGATYNDLYNAAGTEYTVTAAANRYIQVDPDVFAGIRYLRLVSGSTELGERTITLVTKPA